MNISFKLTMNDLAEALRRVAEAAAARKEQDKGARR